MPNIAIYVKDDIYAKFINANEELKKETKLMAVKAIEQSLNKT